MGPYLQLGGALGSVVLIVHNHKLFFWCLFYDYTMYGPKSMLDPYHKGPTFLTSTDLSTCQNCHIVLLKSIIGCIITTISHPLN